MASISSAVAAPADFSSSVFDDASDVIGRGGAWMRGYEPVQAWTPMSGNERKTENLVRDSFRKLGYYNEASDIRVEEQKSNIESVRKLLRVASKSCQGGKGSPEFIVSDPSNPDFLLIVECKGDVRDHSATDAPTFWCNTTGDADENYAKRCQRFGVDGVLHYARHLSKEFNVIAVAISGETQSSASISTFLHTKGDPLPKELKNKDGKSIDALIRWADYIEHATFDPAVQRMRFDELMAFSRDLHEFMRDHAKLTESEKPLLVSGTLIALRNKAFSISYDAYTPPELQKEWMRVIQKEIAKAVIPKAKKAKMTQPYSSIAVHPELGKSTKTYPRGVLHELIKRLNEKVWPFIGVEQQPNMFALAASNMILRGDGKANLYQGSCFDTAIAKEIKSHKCNVGLLNPPFSQGDEDQHELRFIKQMMDALVPGATGIAIAPMSCAISPHPARAELLKFHTLEAVMSLPAELFYPVGTITCAMVFSAHRPHAESGRKSWFGYWKDDGFVKTKHLGRIDLKGRWAAIRDRWVEAFRNREVKAGESVTQSVTAQDEWCAEAYMETDYSTLGPDDFEREVKRYIAFQILDESALGELGGDEEAE